MSIGGDLVGETIALLQPIYTTLGANIIEYGGELDDMSKDDFELPTFLYTDSSNGPTSTVLVEYNGVDHEPQDGSNVVYLNTYKVNVWVVAGYRLATAHQEGGAPLHLETGYRLYDAVLDLLAGRKLLKDAETVRILKGERVYFGNSDSVSAVSWADTEASAVVYKLEFSVKAQSVWDVFGNGPVTQQGDPWYTASGDVINDETGFAASLAVTLSEPYVDFAERCIQYLPNDRISWRPAFGRIERPVAVFPCNDNPSDGLTIADVMDGVELTLSGTGVAAGSALYRRTCAGLYANDYKDLVRFNPVRGLELVGADDSWGYVADDAGRFDPPGTTANQAISGFIVARMDLPTGDRTLMAKWDGDTSKGWSLTLGAGGLVTLSVCDAASNSGTVSTTVSIADGSWTAILFGITYDADGGAVLSLLTPYESCTTNMSALVSLSNTGGAYRLFGCDGHLAFAALWQGPSSTYAVATEENFRTLWRGTALSVSTSATRGVVLERTATMAWPTQKDGAIVARLSANNGGSEIVAMDPYTVNTAGVRALPGDASRTNLLEYSELFSSWTGAPSTTVLAESPSGRQNADVLSDGSSIAANAEAASTGAHVFSVWARSSDGGTFDMTLDGATALPGKDTFSPGESWSRYSVYVTTLLSTSTGVAIESSGATGTSVEIWGAQLESGETPTAYIPTAGAAQECTTSECKVRWDVLPSVSASHGEVRAILYPNTRMIDAEATSLFTAFEVEAGSEYVRAVGTMDGSGNMTWSLETSLSGSTVSSDTSIALTEETALTVAARWRKGAVELWVEGEMAGSAAASSSGFAQTPTACHIMRKSDGQNPWIGSCKELRWWK